MKLRNKILALCIAPVICVGVTRAQDSRQTSQQTDPSAPPANSGLGGGYSKPPAAAARGVANSADPDQPYGSAQLLPDQNTLSGAQNFGVGSLDHTRNIFDPAISVSELGATGQNLSGTGTSGTGLNSQTLLGGTMTFDRSWDIFHITAIYNGGVNIYAGPSTSTYQFQNLTFIEEANWARWHVLFRDNFVAGPGAEFTGAGMGGPGLVAQFSSLLGASLTSVAQSFGPTQTIETGNAMRYMDTVLGQAEYSFSRRSALTVAASYGLLDFTGPGFISSSMLNVQAGYDYLLDPNNSIAVLGSYGKIDYIGTASSTSVYTGALAYGRKITGRLAFQAAVGPQEVTSANTSNGIGGNGDFHLLSWFANSALTYNRRRFGTSVSFSRGVTAGSGVFMGSLTNTFTGSAHYAITRRWLGSVSAGYAINNELVPAGVDSIRFDNWFVGANIGRPVGRHAQVNFNYGLQRQNVPSICPVASCGGSGFQQTFGTTVNWHLRRSG
jgi:hypothetical protein